MEQITSSSPFSPCPPSSVPRLPSSSFSSLLSSRPPSLSPARPTMAAVQSPSTISSFAGEPQLHPVSPKERERPLPPLPPAEAKHPKPSSKTTGATSNLSAVAAGKRRAVALPPMTSSEGIRQLLKNPVVLFRLLAATDWLSFHALISTRKEFRQFFGRTELRDVVLSRFVPGYALCLGRRDIAELSLDITLEDLALFHMSQNIPLHIYPMHALAIVGSPRYQPDIFPTDPYSIKLASLAQTHTRIVLLLQSLVHSGHAFTYTSELDDFALSPSSAPPIPVVSGVRELVFPKPLAHCEHEGTDQKAKAVPGHASPAGRRGSTGTLRKTYSRTEPRASMDFETARTLSRSRSRLRSVTSMFGRGSKVPLPPPSEHPPALGYYVGSWRRTLTHHRSASGSYTASDDEDDFLPRPRFPGNRSSSLYRSAESSVGSTSPSSSRSNTHTDSTDASSVNPKESTKSFNASPSPVRPSSSSPHDISMATSRFKAPLLRVFVPCTQLDEIAITACEEQLVDGGLWDHLSAGDIICNFGFVPPAEADDASQTSGDAAKPAAENGHRRRWLLFNGYCLVHYIPPSPPPLENSLTLPSPFYFSHILPPFTDPRFVLALPPLPSRFMAGRAPRGRTLSDGPYAQLTLTNVRTRVPSAHSPGGYAVVKKYIWLARIPYVGPRSGTSAGEALGEGWQGEWVLEAEGTKEGRQCLLDAVKAGADNATRRGLWEVVRDKSGGGRIWMRLVTPNVDANAQERRTPDFD